MTEPTPIPMDKFQAGDFLGSIGADDLVYFLLNVGDADCQLIVLPKLGNRPREGIVVDVGLSGKLPALLKVLEDKGLVGDLRVVVATHPHLDHIRGMSELLHAYRGRISEYWDSGYRHPSPVYFGVLRELEAQQDELAYIQPTSGMTRYFGRVRMTVLAPSIALRNRYDSYGIDPNNASICLKLDYPVTRAVQEDDKRFLQDKDTEERTVTRMILGADAQMLSWGHVLEDFPDLEPDESTVWRALGMKNGFTPLRAEILKVPHHCSKNGVTVELAKMVNARLALVSSLGTRSGYGFPHALAQGALREAKEAIAQSGLPTWTKQDDQLGIHYTGGTDSAGAGLGSIALVIKATGKRAYMWRFGDPPEKDLDLAQGRRYVP